MSAYIIANFEVTDREGFARYVESAPATVAAYGGEYLARGGVTELLEGELLTGRVVVVRFPSTKAAMAWYRSPEYASLREVRLRAARGPLLITAGLDEEQADDHD
jgi:uncharacterized protein (DUF1330 family)